MDSNKGWSIPEIIRIGDKLYFECVRSDMDSTLLGAEIIQIDSLPTNEYLEKEIYPFIPCYTPNAILDQAAIILQRGLIGSYKELIVKKYSGEYCSFTLGYNARSSSSKGESYKYIGIPSVQKNIDLYWREKIAILTINSFSESRGIGFIMDSLASEIINNKAEGVVIDIRNNRGGSTELAWQLQMYLSPADSIRTFGARTRINSGYKKSQGNYVQEYEDFFNGVAYEDMPFEYIPREKDKGYFNFPIKILIGSGTASAAEDFLVNIYELPQRPTLIGEQTLGSTGAPYVFILPHNAMAKVCTLQIKFPYSNKIFTKGGIIPDIQISPTIDDYFNEYDRVLEETLQTF